MKFKFNDFETEFDNTDVGFLEKYVAESQKLHEAASRMDAASDGVAAFKAGCEAVDELFNALFGEGSAEKMFGTRKSYKEHLSAMVGLRKAVEDTSEIDAIDAEIRALVGRKA